MSFMKYLSTFFTIFLACYNPLYSSEASVCQVSETVAEIMERANNRDNVVINEPKSIPNKFKSRKLSLTSHEARLPAQLAFPTNFTGVTFPQDSFYVPPDSMGCVGPTQFLITVNGHIKSFSKVTNNGSYADGVLDIAPEDFFASIFSPTDPVTDYVISDPRVRYDIVADPTNPLNGRWIIQYAAFYFADDPTKSSKFMIAVSDGPIITSSTAFNFFSFIPRDVSPVHIPPIPGYFPDFPTLGIDVNALYIGCPVFDNSEDNPVTSDGFVVNKADLYAGTLTVTAFRDLMEQTAPFAGPTVPYGVDNFDIMPPSTSQGYFIGHNDDYFDTLFLRIVHDPGSSTPTIGPNIAITVPIEANPLAVPSEGNTIGANGYLDSIDRRVGNANIRNNQLYTVQALGVDNQGNCPTPAQTASIKTDTRSRTGCRWFQFNMDGVNDTTPPSTVQLGTIFEATPTNNMLQRYYWMPSIMTNTVSTTLPGRIPTNTLLVGFSTAGIGLPTNCAFAIRHATDPINQINKPQFYTENNQHYNVPIGTEERSIQRWGDYSYVSMDPTNGLSFWTIQEFCPAKNNWGVRVVEIQNY